MKFHSYIGIVPLCAVLNCSVKSKHNIFQSPGNLCIFHHHSHSTINMLTACIFFQTYHLDRITCRSAAILHAMFPWNIIQSSTTISTSYLPLDLPCLSTKRNNQSRLNQAEVHIKKKYYGLITEHLQLKPMTSDWLFTAQEESLLCSQEPVMWHYVSQMNPVHSLSSSSSIPILMLCQHLGLPNGLFPSGFQTKTCMHVTSPYTCHMPLPSHPPRFISSQIIGV